MHGGRLWRVGTAGVFYFVNVGAVLLCLRWRTTCNGNLSDACLGAQSAGQGWYLVFLLILVLPVAITTRRSREVRARGGLAAVALTALFWATLLA